MLRFHVKHRRRMRDAREAKPAERRCLALPTWHARSGLQSSPAPVTALGWERVTSVYRQSAPSYRPAINGNCDERVSRETSVKDDACVDRPRQRFGTQQQRSGIPTPPPLLHTLSSVCNAGISTAHQLQVAP